MRDSDNNSELDFERITVLFSNAFTAQLGFALSVLFIYFIIYEYSSPNAALYWVIAVIIISLPRFILSIIFKRRLENQKITPDNIRPWENYYILSFIFPYLCLAAALFFPYQENVLASVLFCAVVFTFLISGGILAHSTSKILVLIYLNIILLPLIIKLFLMQDILFTTLACYIFIAYFILTRMILKLNKLLIENIALKIENKNQSLLDPLTKLCNRRRLYLHIEKLMPITRRSGEPFSIIMLDIDHFKQYNDTHGHSAGDDLLVKVSKYLLECSREQDLVVRYGGEEFIVVLPSTNIEQAKVIAERIHASIKENTDVTISAGLAIYSDQMDFEKLVKQADKALYAAKEDGRNRFIVAENV